MSTAANQPGVFAAPAATAEVRAYSASIPWYIWLGVLAITSSSIGGAWDVSWHRSIGRDTFWTPAHMAIYACGVLAGIICSWLIVKATFLRDPELSAASVNVFGLRAPLGIFLAGWGCVAVLTSAPFDNWWHNAYGLDVKIVSPPHALLILGLRGISTGVMFLILAAMNRAAENDEATFKRLQMLLVYVGGLAVVGQMFFVQEYTWDVKAASSGSLHCDGDRIAGDLRRALLGVAVALGGHFHGGGVYRLSHCRNPHSSAVPCATKAGPGLQPRSRT